MLLKKIVIHKFKCFESEQSFDVDEDVTVLVGLNESGKTSVLQAIAKTNYFESDANFAFNLTPDYPRKEKKAVDKSGQNPRAVTSTYSIDDNLRSRVNDDIGGSGFTSTEVSIASNYKGGHTFGGVTVDNKLILDEYHPSLAELLEGVKNLAELEKIIEDTDDEGLARATEKVKRLYQNKWEWDNPIEEYVARVWINESRPKYLYYDEYYALPSRINIEELQNETLDSDELKTAKALFDLADINIEELINSDDFDDFKAELEATEATISEVLFEYWSTNKNLEIQFAIDKVEKTIANRTTIVEHILDIRVRNNRAKVSLPLKNRSKGFNWFFSFLVWFKKIQEDSSSSYILLLDEPGLNLHAAAQADLLDFIESLSENYQVIFTTHSPFMVASDKLHRTRTVLETDNGSVISDSLQEKDPNTLFPLQAALGYHIAQNLYVSKKNLLVEGVSDLVYLQVISTALEAAGRTTKLSDDITIVPVGGMDKIATFVSLLRGNKLNLVCLLDSTIGQSGATKLERLITDKIIKENKVLHYRDYIKDAVEADVEDLFSEADYLKIFNGAFQEHSNIKKADLSSNNENRIVEKISEHLAVKRFNHYRPSNYLAQELGKKIKPSTVTLDNFEAVIQAVNVAMDK